MKMKNMMRCSFAGKETAREMIAAYVICMYKTDAESLSFCISYKTPKGLTSFRRKGSRNDVPYLFNFPILVSCFSENLDERYKVKEESGREAF